MTRDGTLFPDPKYQSETQLQMLEFVGAIMGLALRMEEQLPFLLSPSVWKAILGEPRTLDDVFAEDPDFAVTLGHVIAHDSGDDLFAALCLTFQVPLIGGTPTSTGVLKSLAPQGERIAVTKANCGAFARLYAAARAREGRHASAAISRGLARVVPLPVLRSLYLPSELEEAVCGPDILDLAAIAKKATFEASFPFEKDRKVAATVFWSIIESLSHADQSKFIHFVTGRSRGLVAMKITSKSGGDGALPSAATCFRQLRLPAYSSPEVLREKLLIAITHGGGFAAEAPSARKVSEAERFARTASGSVDSSFRPQLQREPSLEEEWASPAR